MFLYIIALIWALMNPVHNSTNVNNNNGQVITLSDGDDTGGENGTIPPKPPTKP